MKTSYLDIHGVKIRVSSHLSSVIDHLEHDFHYFLNDEPQDFDGKDVFRLRMVAAGSPPQYWVPYFKTRRSSLYFSRPGERRVCFFGKAWVVYQFKNRFSEIYCSDSEVAYEACYLVLLSYIGESLDLQGLHRIHGLGFAVGEIGAILMAPSGGGKSRLGIELLERSTVKILSDDTPVLTSGAVMIPFPQRIALKEKPLVEDRFVRKFSRVLQGDKFVVGSEYFINQISDPVKVRWLILVRRKKSEHASIDRSHRLNALWPVFKWLVIGYETPQIWELFLRLSLSEVWGKFLIFFRRLKTAFQLLRETRVVLMTLSADVEKSYQALGQFVQLWEFDRV